MWRSGVLLCVVVCRWCFCKDARKIKDNTNKSTKIFC
nr:MAG TPA: hypothetical protein [Caudoviricetes sp.]